MITNGGGAGIEGAGVGADDSLSKIGILQPLVLKIALDELGHGPMEEHVACFLVIAQACVDLLLSGCIAYPEIALSCRPQRIAQTPHYGGHRLPAI